VTAKRSGLLATLSRIIEKRAPRPTPPVKPGKSFGSIWLALVFSGRYKRNNATSTLI